MRLSSLFVPVLLAAFLALSACGREGGTDRAPEPGDRSVAEVQGQTIWASDVKREAVAFNRLAASVAGLGTIGSAGGHTAGFSSTCSGAGSADGGVSAAGNAPPAGTA